jgi:hypothetical protein
VGFNVHSRGTILEIVFEEVDPSDRDCKVSQADVEEWIDADK